MSILRAELQGTGTRSHYTREDGRLGTRVSGIFDGIVETEADLDLPATADFEPGSLMLCLANKHVYVKNSQERWEEVSG